MLLEKSLFLIVYMMSFFSYTLTSVSFESLNSLKNNESLDTQTSAVKSLINRLLGNRSSEIEAIVELSSQHEYVSVSV